MVEPARPRSSRDIAPSLPVWRRAVYGLLTCALWFLGLELALYLFGVARVSENHDPYVSFVATRPLFVPEESSDPAGEAFAKWQVTSSERLRFFNLQRFLTRKPRDGKRIFCLGGSTTYGHPYDDRTSFCGWLRVWLQQIDPETTWEVVNAGGISYASYRVAALMEELASAEPDVFIVLTGHNEFLEARSYASPLRQLPAPLQALGPLVTSSRTFAALRRTLHRTGANLAPDRERLPTEVDALLDHSTGLAAYVRDDAQRRDVLAHFELNLRRMQRISRAAGARMLWVVPASNLRDCAPFKAVPDPSLSDAQRELLDQQLRAARTAQAAAQYARAEGLWSRALELDPAHAEALYQLGHVRFLRGEPDEARRLWIRARDADVCPLRAASELESATRSIARASGSMRVDLPRLLEQLAEQHGHPSTAGAELFLDHVHPTPEVHGELAEAILAELVRTGIVEPMHRIDASARERVRAAIDATRSPEREGIALRNLAKVSSWAGKSREAAALARRALQVLGDDPESAFILGAEALERDDDEAARHWFTQVVELDPDYAKAHTNLGIVLARMGDRSGARAHYDAALALTPRSATALYNRAGLALDEGDYASAIRDFERAAELAPHDTATRVELARARLRSGDRTGAMREYQQLKRTATTPPEQQVLVDDLARRLSADRSR